MTLCVWMTLCVVDDTVRVNDTVYRDFRSHFYTQAGMAYEYLKMYIKIQRVPMIT